MRYAVETRLLDGSEERWRRHSHHSSSAVAERKAEWFRSRGVVEARVVEARGPGRPPLEAAKRVRVDLTLPPLMASAIEAVAQERGVSRSALVETALLRDEEIARRTTP